MSELRSKALRVKLCAAFVLAGPLPVVIVVVIACQLATIAQGQVVAAQEVAQQADNAALVIASLDKIATTLGLAEMLLPMLAALTTGLTMVLGAFVIRGVFNPLDRVTAAVEEISQNNPDIRLQVSGQDEIAQLSGAINRALNSSQAVPLQEYPRGEYQAEEPVHSM